MVAVISGNGLGLGNTSLSQIGSLPGGSAASVGQSKSSSYLNIATGNLVLQSSDAGLTMDGTPLSLVRTYNSLGQSSSSGTTPDAGWWSALRRNVTLTGTLDTAGSTVIRQGDDGSSVSYTYDTASGRYLSSGQSGVQDVITWNPGTSSWTLTDGATQSSETYDASGRLVGLNNAVTGAAFTLSYDAQGRLSQIADGTDTLTLTYDANGRLSTIAMSDVPPGGSSPVTRTLVTYTYDSLGRLASVGTSLAGDGTASAATYVTSYTYNAQGEIASVAQSDGTVMSYTYDAENRVVTITVGTGATAGTTTITYDLPGPMGTKITKVADPDGNTWTYAYDTAGKLTRLVCPSYLISSSWNTEYNGNLAVEFSYDASGNLISRTGNGTTTYSYDATGDLLRIATSTGEADYTYDSNHNRLTSTTYAVAANGSTPASGAMTTYNVYDASGRLAFSVDPTGAVTQTVYNGAGLAMTTRRFMGALYPVSNVSSTNPPSLSDMASWAAAQDISRTARVDYSYDVRGQLASQTQWSAVDASGIGVANSSASYTTFVYDAMGFLRQQTTLRGTNQQTAETTTYSYDGIGRLLSSTDPTGRLSSYVYDDAHGTIVLHQAGGLVTTEVFDSAGRLVTNSQQDTATGVTRTTHDLYGNDGRLRVSFDATAQPTYYFYNGLGAVVATVHAAGNATEYLYAPADGQVLPAGQTNYATRIDVSTWLNTSGSTPIIAALPQGWTPPLATASDRSTLTEYDQNGVPTTVIAPTGRQTTLYHDGSGRVVSSETNGAYTVYAYDADGRLAASLDAGGYATTYTYDAAGNVAEVVAYANYVHISASTTPPPTLSAIQAALVASPSDRVTHNYYDGDGRLVASIDAGGFVTSNTYDETQHSITSTRYATALTATQLASLTSNESASTILGLVAAGSGSQQSTALYDADNRVTLSTTPDGTTTAYTYDGAGNLQSTKVTPAAGHGQVTTTSATHDAFGDVTSATSAAGETSTAVYDADGRAIRTTDALGNSTYSYYDAAGRLAYTVRGQPSGAARNVFGDTTGYTYNAFGQVATKQQYSSRLDASAGAIDFANATTVQIASAITALGATAGSPDSITSFTYNAAGQPLSATDARGYSTTYDYGSDDRIADSYIQYASPGMAPTSGNSAQVTYNWMPRGDLYYEVGPTSTVYNFPDAFGGSEMTEVAFGTSVNFTYKTFNNLGEVVSTELQSDNASRSSVATFDAFGRTLTTQDGTGAVTTYQYNDASDSTSVTTPDGIVMSTTRDAYGHIVSVTNGLGQTTTTSYDADGRPVSTTDATGNVSSTVYDADGHAISTTDAAGRAVAYTYDADGHVLTRTVDPSGLKLVTTYAYDGQGRELSVTDPAGVVSTFTYDAVGNKLTQIVDAGPGGEHLTSTYTYDGEGNVLTTTVGVGTASARTTQFVYDGASPRNVVAVIVDPGQGHLNLTTSYTYDGLGHLLSVTNPGGQVTRNVYDGIGDKLFTVSPLGIVTQYTYDADGRVTSTRVYSTPLTNFTLTDSTRDSALSAALTTSSSDEVSYTFYDGDGHARYIVDGSGHVSELRYDAAGRVIQTLRYSTPIGLSQSTLAQDAQLGKYSPSYIASALSQAGDTDASAETSLTLYDADGRARFVLTQNGGGTQAYVAELRYDADGNVTDRIAYGSPLAVTAGTPLASQFSLASVTSAVTSMANERTSTVYDAAGRAVFSIDASGHVTAQTYDAAGNVAKVAVYASAIVLPPPLTVASVTAALGGATPAQFQSMTYDTLGRLVTRSNALGVQQTYSYDASGLLASVTDHDGHTTSYQYDDAGRVTLVESPAVTVGSYGTDGLLHTTTQHLYTSTTYDANGRALSVSKGAGADATHIVMLQTVSYTYDALGQLVSTTECAPGSVDPVTGAFVAGGSTATSTSQYDAFGHKVVQTDGNGHTTYSAYDAQGRLAYVVDATGAVTAYGYDAFGNRTSVSKYPTPLPISTSGALPGWSPGQPLNQSMLDAITSSSSPNYIGVPRVTTYAYDQRNELVSETDPSVTYTYSSGASVGSSASGTPITRYTYDGYGNTTSKSVLIQGAPGQTGNDAPIWATTYTYYDALNRATTVVDPMGFVTTSSYDGLGQLLSTRQYATAVPTSTLSVTSPPVPPANASTDRVTTYTYDNAGRETSQTRTGLYSDVGGVTGVAVSSSVTTYTYDGESRVLTSTVNGATTTLTYDAAGRVVSVSEPTRQALVSNWQSLLAANPSLDLTSVSLYISVSPTTTNVYDALGDLISSTVAAGNLQQTTRSYYDAWGRQVMQVDAEGNRTQNGYDSVGNLISQTRDLTGGDGSTTQVTTTYAYDGVNRRTDSVTSRTDGTVDSHEAVSYDAFGEVATRGDGTSVTHYAYDADGNLIGSPNTTTGSEHTYGYDLAGRLVDDWTTTVGGAVVRTQNTLDLDGNILRQTAPGSSDTSNPATDPTVLRQFDRWGNVLSLTDADGNITTYQYDALNQVVQETEAGVLVVDEHGARTVQSPTRQWYYDIDGRLVGTRDENGHTQSIVNDAVGNQVLMTDATNATSITAYDALGRQVAAQNANGAITWEAYNGLNQVVARGDFGATVRGSAVTLQTYVLNQDGDRIRVLDALGNATAYVYDSQHRILKSQTTDQAAAGVADTYAYDVHGNTTRHTTALGDTATWTYDYYGRVLSHTDLSGAAYTYTYDANSGLLTQTTSNWKAPGQTDPAFLSTAITGATSSTTYSYYVDGKIKQITTSTGSDVYTYDADGNQTSDTIKTIDANGNAINSEILTSFDSHGRIQTVTTENSDTARGQMREIFNYDAAGNRRAVFVQSSFGANAAPIDLNPGIPAVGTPMGTQFIEAGSSLVYTVPTSAFTDPMGVGLTYTASQAGGAPLPSWMSFNAGNHTFTGTAPAGATSYTITVTGTDVLGRTISTTFTLNVSTAKPTFAGTLTPANVIHGTAFSFTAPVATDPNSGVTYAAVYWNGTAYVALPAWVTFNPSTMMFSGTAPAIGSYTFVLQAMNGYGGYTNLTFALHSTGHAPSFGSATAPTPSVVAGQPFSFTMPAATDDDTISYTGYYWNGSAYVALPSWVTFNPNTRTFSGTAPTGAGAYGFAITAASTGGAVSMGVALTVNANTPPTFTGTPTPHSVNTNQGFAFTMPGATDPLSGVTYYGYLFNGSSYVALPSWVTFNAANLTFSGTAPATAGTYQFAVIAYNAYGAGSIESSAFTVNAPRPPQTTGNLPIPSTMYTNNTYNLTMPAGTFTNPSGGSLVYSIGASSSTYGAWSINSSTGTISVRLSGQPPYSGWGISVTVTATDPATGLSVSATKSVGINRTQSAVVQAPSVVQTAQVAQVAQTTPTAPNVQAYWFTYDQDNRVVVDNGALLGDSSGYHVGITASQGSASNTYDAAGNIKTYTTVNTSNVTSTQLNIYDNRNELVTVETPNSKGVIGVHETRSYDDDGRLVSDAYYNDAGSTGTGTYNGSTITVDTSGWLSNDIVNNYDADGNLVYKTQYAARNFQDQISASGAAVQTGAYAAAAKTLPVPPPTPPANASASNADGPLNESQGYQYHYSLEGDVTSEENDTTTLNGQTASAIGYTMSYIKKDGYLESTTVGTGNMGTTSNYYDNDGHLVATEAPQTSGSSTYVVRSSAVNASGDIVQRHVYAVDGSSSETDVYAYAAGHALGDVDETGDFNVLESLTNFSNSDSGTTNYVVQVSDTLASIAQAVYGNASMAYIIAAANGLGTNGPAMLVAGSTLVIPQVLNATNTADTFRPYNPMAVLDTPTFQVPNALPVSPEPDDGQSSADRDAEASPGTSVGSAAASSASTGKAQTESSLFRAAFIHPVALLEIAPGDGDDYDHGSGGGAGMGDGGYDGGYEGGGDYGGDYGDGDVGDDGDGGDYGDGDIGDDDGGDGDVGDGDDDIGNDDGSDDVDNGDSGDAGSTSSSGASTSNDGGSGLPPIPIDPDVPQIPAPDVTPPPPPPGGSIPQIVVEVPTPSGPSTPTGQYAGMQDWQPSAPAPNPGSSYISSSAPELQDPSNPSSDNAGSGSDPFIQNYNDNYASQRWYNVGDGAPGYGGNDANFEQELADARSSVAAGSAVGNGKGDGSVLLASNGTAPATGDATPPDASGLAATGLPSTSELQSIAGLQSISNASDLSDMFGDLPEYGAQTSSSDYEQLGIFGQNGVDLGGVSVTAGFGDYYPYLSNPGGPSEGVDSGAEAIAVGGDTEQDNNPLSTIGGEEDARAPRQTNTTWELSNYDYAGLANASAGVSLGTAQAVGELGIIRYGFGINSPAGFAPYLVASGGKGASIMSPSYATGYLQVGGEAAAMETTLVSGAFNWSKAVPLLEKAGWLSALLAPGIEAYGLERQPTTNASDWEHVGVTLGTSLGVAKIGGPYGILLGVAWTALDTYAQGTHYIPSFGPDAGQRINGWTALHAIAVDNREFGILNLERAHPGTSHDDATEWYDSLETIRRLEAAEDR